MRSPSTSPASSKTRTARCTAASSTRPCSSTSPRRWCAWSAPGILRSRGSGAPAAASGGKPAPPPRSARPRPVLVPDPTVEIAPDPPPATLEYPVAAPREPVRILGQLSRGRFGVRLLGRRTERAREFPAPPPAAILDDSVFALYLPVAWRGPAPPLAVTRVFPRAGRPEGAGGAGPRAGGTAAQPRGA